MSVEYISGQEYLDKVISGIEKLANLVSTTLGPNGRTVLISPQGIKPFFTKDGHYTAKGFSLSDIYENVGAQIAKEVSEKNATLAGDGSTTVLILLNAILQQSKKYIASGADINDFKNGLNKAAKIIIENLIEKSKQITCKQDIFNVATISANNDKEIGKIVSEAIDSIGKDGSVVVEESKTSQTFLRIVEGFTFDTGYISNQFVTDERKQIISYKDPLIFITDRKFTLVQEMYPVLEIAARDERPLIVIAEEISGQALSALILNSLKKNMKIAAIKPPSYGTERRNILEDLCIATGATYFTRESGLQIKNVKLEHFGVAKSIEIQRNFTTIVDGNGDIEKVKDRIDALKEAINQSNDIEECKRIQERITRLSSGVAIIYVGGSTSSEMEERKHRIEDAVEAAKSSIQEGIILGGGVTLMQVAKIFKEKIDDFAIEDEKLGALTLYKAIQEPFNKIILNSHKNPEVIASQCDFEKGNGYNAFSGKINVSMEEEGIIDVTKVVKLAIEHSLSIALAILNSNACIIEL